MATRRVLILGANSAIAAEVARLCAARGDTLYLVARDPDKLSRLVGELDSSVVGHATGDFEELEQNAARVDEAIRTLGGCDVAFLAHGLLGDQLRSEGDLAHAEQIIRSNFTSAVSLLLPLANYLEAQGRGHLCVITSVAGERGRPRNYTYGSAKGALTRYLQGLRSRLYRTAVRVQNIKLGPVDTPMTVDHDKHLLFGRKDRVARGIVRAFDSRRHVVYLPRIWRLVMFLVRLTPEPVFQRFGFLAGR